MTCVSCEESCALQESAMDTHLIIFTVSGMGGERCATQRGQEHSPRPHSEKMEERLGRVGWLNCMTPP